jgi:hypothetical protein
MRILIWHTRWPKQWPSPARFDPAATLHEQWFGPVYSKNPPEWLEKFKIWGDR